MTAPQPYARAESGDTERFTLAERQLCEHVAAELYATGQTAEGDAWADLAARVQRVLRREFTRFTADDSRRIQAVHIAVLRAPLEEGSKARSRALSRLGVLVALASRGYLPQMEGR